MKYAQLSPGPVPSEYCSYMAMADITAYEHVG